MESEILITTVIWKWATRRYFGDNKGIKGIKRQAFIASEKIGINIAS